MQERYWISNIVLNNMGTIQTTKINPESNFNTLPLLSLSGFHVMLSASRGLRIHTGFSIIAALNCTPKAGPVFLQPSVMTHTCLPSSSTEK